MSIPDTGLLSYDLFFGVMKKYIIKREKLQMVEGTSQQFLKERVGEAIVSGNENHTSILEENIL